MKKHYACWAEKALSICTEYSMKSAAEDDRTQMMEVMGYFPGRLLTYRFRVS